MGVDPVKPSLRTNGWLAIAFPAKEPAPVATFMTPGGKPALTVSSANFKAVSGQT